MTEVVEFPSREQIIAILRKWFSQPGGNPVVINELRSFYQENVLTILGDLSANADPEIQNIASQVLVRFDRDKGINLLLPLLEKSDSGIRLSICYILCDFGDERAVEPLNRVISEDSDADVRYMAAVALWKIGDERAIPALRHAIEHDKGVDYEGDPVARVAQVALEAILARQAK